MSQARAALHSAPHVGLHRHDRRRPKAYPAAAARHALSAGVSTGGGHCNPSGRVARRKASPTRCYATAVDEARQAPRVAVLGIGTANPANCVPQNEYADWYFRVTKSDHLAKLKAKMKRICYNSGIKKRYFHHTTDTFRDHPEIVDRALPSLDARQAILAPAVPEIAATAAAKAIAAWGRPARDVTHLVLATYSGAHMPGADLRLASLLGLRRSTQRTMFYLGGCAAGSAALRVARDVAENNPGARVLAVCAELSLVLFRAPRVADPGTLVMQALFGDGASAVVVGAGAGPEGSGGVECPMFEIMSASQTVIPGSEDAAAGHLGEGGLAFCPSPRMPNLVRQHVEECLLDAVSPLGLGGGWNDLFWAVHPGGTAILDGVEAELALAPGKLAASRRVLSEYGNMSGASMIFVLDELWRRHREEMDGRLGVMLGLGPGISVETMVLRSMSGTEKK
uniref:Chalcone/stilbene synthase N-terminal domain-containing protein n=1 Tax=Setaria viridis TaxID=4556 RepID=A0A4U6TJ91_SETVI|nr:hypothetical protein SEVIR_8G149400v2 [Setaria viridis]